MDDVLPGEGCVIVEILPVLWLDVQLVHSLDQKMQSDSQRW